MNKEIQEEILKIKISYEKAAMDLENLDKAQLLESLNSFDKLKSLNSQMSSRIKQFLDSANDFDDSAKQKLAFNISILSEEISKINEVALKLAVKLKQRFEEVEGNLLKNTALHGAQMEQLETIHKLMEDDGVTN
jgi:hypothetical protein